MIVSAKPLFDSRAENGYSLCADTVATFDKPHTSLVGNNQVHTNVMFYQTSDICSDHRTQGRLYVYREGCVKNLVSVCEDLANKQLTVFPFAPNLSLSWIYDESFITKTSSPWMTKFQKENGDQVPHAGAFLEFDSLRCELRGEVVAKLTAEIAFSLLKAKDVVVMSLTWQTLRMLNPLSRSVLLL